MPEHSPTPATDAGFNTENCRTTPLVPDFSICLAKDRLCPHALSFGHQYLCRHPGHAGFAVPPSARGKC